MSALFPSVAEAFPRVTRPLEGCVLWPYLDVFGLATVGYGCLVDSVPEFRKPDWRTLLLADKPAALRIDIERSNLKARPKARHFAQYENATSLRLTQTTADALLEARAEDFAQYMATHHFRDWSTWPADAQLAWMLLAWACGPACPAIFKTAAGLASSRDWAGMRKWARINPGKPGQSNWNPGVVPRNAQIDLCLTNAAEIDNADGYATPALFWPGHVLDTPTKSVVQAVQASSLLSSYDVNECGLTGSCHLPEAA